MTSSNEYDSIVDASSNENQSFVPAAVPTKKLLMGFSMAVLALLGCAYVKVASLEGKVDKMAGLRAAGGVHPVKELLSYEEFLARYKNYSYSEDGLLTAATFYVDCVKAGSRDEYFCEHYAMRYADCLTWSSHYVNDDYDCTPEM